MILTLYELNSAENGNFPIVLTYDIKPLVSQNHDRKRYVYYSTRAKLFKIKIDTQGRDVTIKGLTKSGIH